MDRQYRRNARNNYVVFIGDERLIRDYRLNMVVRNEISGLLRVYTCFVDDRIELSYVITSRQSLKDLFEKDKMNFEALYAVLEAYLDVCHEVQNYLLKPEDILLDPELVFYDYQSHEINFCYFPDSGNTSGDQVRELVEQLMRITDHKDQKGVQFIYGVFDVCHRKDFVLREMEEYVSRFESPDPQEGWGNFEQTRESGVRLYHADRVCEERGNRYGERSFEDRSLEGRSSEEENDSSKMIFKRITDFFSGREKKMEMDEQPNRIQESNHTVYISEILAGTQRTLFSLSEMENITISSYPFVIGKWSSKVDYVLNAKTVSRMHLKIMREEDAYYMEDLNSKNGSYLNGIQAMPHEKVKIEIGDKIRISEYEYIFQ